jgi:MFS family permease
MALYCVASAFVIVAPAFETLLVARVLQGVGSAAARVIATSIVRDCYSGRRMASVMSLAMMLSSPFPWSPLAGSSGYSDGRMEWRLHVADALRHNRADLERHAYAADFAAFRAQITGCRRRPWRFWRPSVIARPWDMRSLPVGFRAVCLLLFFPHSEVIHYSRIASQCLKVMGTLRPYLTLTLRNRTAVRGWLVRLTQGRNSEQDLSIVPTAWRGSVVLQDGERETEFDFLAIDTVRSGAAPDDVTHLRALEGSETS